MDKNPSNRLDVKEVPIWLVTRLRRMVHQAHRHMRQNLDGLR